MKDINVDTLCKWFDRAVAVITMLCVLNLAYTVAKL